MVKKKKLDQLVSIDDRNLLLNDFLLFLLINLCSTIIDSYIDYKENFQLHSINFIFEICM